MEQNGNKKPAGVSPRTWVAMRRCLSCGASFVALSPFLRVCEVCKQGEDWQSGNVDIVDHQPMPANDN